MFYRAAFFNPSIHKNWEISKLITYVFRALLEDEENQIRGIVHICDTTGFGLNFLTVYAPKDLIRIYINGEVAI